MSELSQKIDRDYQVECMISNENEAAQSHGFTAWDRSNNDDIPSRADQYLKERYWDLVDSYYHFYKNKAAAELVSSGEIPQNWYMNDADIAKVNVLFKKEWKRYGTRLRGTHAQVYKAYNKYIAACERARKAYQEKLKKQEGR